MNSLIKRVVVTMFSLILILCCSGFVSPTKETESDGNRSEQILEIIDEMCEQYALIEKANSVEKTFLKERIKVCKERLADLGAEVLSREEVYERFGNVKNLNGENTFPQESNTSHMIKTRATVTWTTFEEDVIYNGTTYHVRKLVAAGADPGGMLVMSGNHTFFSGQNKSISGLSTAGSIVVHKATGDSTVLTWLPSVMFPSYLPSSKVNAMSVSSYTCKSRIMFTYVTAPGGYEWLSYYSNGLNLSVDYHSTWSRTGGVDYTDVPKSIVANGTYYNSSIVAIQAYLGIVGMYDYSSGFTMYAYNQSYSNYLSVPNPMVGPGQIY